MPKPAMMVLPPVSALSHDLRLARSFMRSLARFLRRARLQHFGASRSFGIFELSVLRDNQCPAQRDHHQNAEQAAEYRHEHHPR